MSILKGKVEKFVWKVNKCDTPKGAEFQDKYNNISVCVENSYHLRDIRILVLKNQYMTQPTPPTHHRLHTYYTSNEAKSQDLSYDILLILIRCTVLEIM